MDQYQQRAIDRLKKRIDSNKEEREAYRKKFADLENRVREVAEAKETLRMSFWCEECQSDVDTKGTKIIRKHPGKLPIAWWVGFCPNRHKVIRRISDKINDPYYTRSFMVRFNRMRYADDLLTPDDHMFWVKYGHLHGFHAYKTKESFEGGKPAHTY